MHFTNWYLCSVNFWKDLSLPFKVNLKFYECLWLIFEIISSNLGFFEVHSSLLMLLLLFWPSILSIFTTISIIVSLFIFDLMIPFFFEIAYWQSGFASNGDIFATMRWNLIWEWGDLFHLGARSLGHSFGLFMDFKSFYCYY